MQFYYYFNIINDIITKEIFKILYKNNLKIKIKLHFIEKISILSFNYKLLDEIYELNYLFINQI